jgi:hypothetical protein
MDRIDAATQHLPRAKTGDQRQRNLVRLSMLCETLARIAPDGVFHLTQEQTHLALAVSLKSAISLLAHMEKVGTLCCVQEHNRYAQQGKRFTFHGAPLLDSRPLPKPKAPLTPAEVRLLRAKQAAAQGGITLDLIPGTWCETWHLRDARGVLLLEFWPDTGGWRCPVLGKSDVSVKPNPDRIAVDWAIKLAKDPRVLIIRPGFWFPDVDTNQALTAPAGSWRKRLLPNGAPILVKLFTQPPPLPLPVAPALSAPQQLQFPFCSPSASPLTALDFLDLPTERTLS